uniref:Uncharacterized protein n=1 Tax=Nicotiana tabacum TaxID=4097 RepID=A0A1S3XIZ7_TOBAC|nr:PREDICTED: uncharacterized protein LOC107765724 [Nicotiana tabacum]
MLCDDAVISQIPDIVSRLKESIEGITTQRPYSERLWRELSKGRWEARNHGLPKDVKMRPPSADDNIYVDPPSPKQDKEKKRRKAPSSSSPEKKRSRKRLARKPKNASALELSSDSLHRLRYESKEEEDSDLVARVRSGFKLPQAMETIEEAAAEVSEPRRVETLFPQAKEVEKEVVIGTSRLEDNVPKEALGVIDLSKSPSFTDSMINEAQTLKGNLGEGAQGAADSFHNFIDGLDSTALEDVTVLGDLPVPKKIPSPGAGGTSSSPKLVNQFPAPSVDPTRRQAIFMPIPKDARVLSAPVEITSYLRCLVTEEDQARMNEVSVLHHEAFLRYREEFKHHEAEIRELAEKKDVYKLLSEKLQAELEAARNDDSNILANDPNPQVQKRLNQIEQLQVEVDTMKVEVNTIEGLQSQLNSAFFGQENLAKELEAAKLEVIMAKTEANDKVAQFKADVEAIQKQARNMVKHARWKSQREALEGVHAQNFDILAEIENAKLCEAKA